MTAAISAVFIWKIYLQMFHNVELLAICDLDSEKTRIAAEKYGVKHIYTIEEMLAGKNAYVEKPLSLEEGKELIALAKEKGLLIGCAPDTFMGSG